MVNRAGRGRSAALCALHPVRRAAPGPGFTAGVGRSGERLPRVSRHLPTPLVHQYRLRLVTIR
ncbi:hypothetical protein SGM_0410 [Streptomyces griseoaurantiacus M045]|uniref:Uncharacterized protein n=1 Tax=Streptomyces griseoaurantiacus M045 TaxID=996637 RepID=F3NAM6_9ACTN|nr:hypothetical protein SGM_0410 [Streptomyces griseoaurantiacus M045]